MTDQTELLMITAADLRSAAGLERLLAAFEASPETTPTHWGPDERAREAYDRDAVIARISGWTHNTGTPGIQRRKPLRYEGYFSAAAGHLNNVSLTAPAPGGAEKLRRLFDLGAALATQLAVEYGVVNLFTTDSPRICKAASRVTGRDVQRNGPPAVGARTWLGPHVLGLLGREALVSLGVELIETPWGGVQFDLLPEPWAAARELLVARQPAAMEALAPSGVFGDYSRPSYAPGQRWAPVPLTAED